MKMVMIYTACGTLEECKKISYALLDKRVAACVNILPSITAIYPWKGKIEEASEIPMLIKTFATHQEEAVQIIRRHHSYDIPGIVYWDAESLNGDYSEWMKENLQTLTK